MKYSNFIGVAAAIILAIACFMPWAYYPDIDKVFTGFFSEQNRYGKPGSFFLILAALAIVLFLIPRVWAKRINMIVVVLAVTFSIRCFMLFSSCYRGICPEKKTGIFLLIIMPLLMLIASVLPDMDLRDKQGRGQP